jgi:hypothetical protein
MHSAGTAFDHIHIDRKSVALRTRTSSAFTQRGGCFGGSAFASKGKAINTVLIRTEQDLRIGNHQSG